VGGIQIYYHIYYILCTAIISRRSAARHAYGCRSQIISYLLLLDRSFYVALLLLLHIYITTALLQARSIVKRNYKKIIVWLLFCPSRLLENLVALLVDFIVISYYLLGIANNIDLLLIKMN
jgi:hypothetical protein